MNDFNPHVKSLLLDGPIFPIYMMSSILGKHNQSREEITKQRIIQIIKNSEINLKKIYLSDISDLLMLSLDNTYNIIAKLKAEGKIKTK
jgi:hypothetical protein